MNWVKSSLWTLCTTLKAPRIQIRKLLCINCKPLLQTLKTTLLWFSSTIVATSTSLISRSLKPPELFKMKRIWLSKRKEPSALNKPCLSHPSWCTTTWTIHFWPTWVETRKETESWLSIWQGTCLKLRWILILTPLSVLWKWGSKICMGLLSLAKLQSSSLLRIERIFLLDSCITWLYLGALIKMMSNKVLSN